MSVELVRKFARSVADEMSKRSQRISVAAVPRNIPLKSWTLDVSKSLTSIEDKLLVNLNISDKLIAEDVSKPLRFTDAKFVHDLSIPLKENTPDVLKLLRFREVSAAHSANIVAIPVALLVSNPLTSRVVSRRQS